jgi:hypothetical protein
VARWRLDQSDNETAVVSPGWIVSSALKIAFTSGTLLVRYSVIHRQQDVVSGGLGRPQQLSILPAFQACPLSRVRLMTGKAVPEIERQALTGRIFMRFWRAGNPSLPQATGPPSHA